MARIAIDAATWTNTRGYGRFTRGILQALLRANTGFRFTLFADSRIAADDLSDFDVRLVPIAEEASKAASAAGRRSLLAMARMSRALSSSEFEAVLFPTVYSYVPVHSRAKKVVFFHDVIADSMPRLTLPSAKGRWLWRLKERLALQQADQVVTVSTYSRQAVARHFGLRLEDIAVVSEAPDPIFRRPEGALPERMVLYAGGFGPHKNVRGLVEAFAAIAPTHPDVRLVLAGENRREVFHSEIGKIERRITELGLAPRVDFSGYVPDEELAELMSRAWVLALPSFMEGFGLPAVEAAACGCPVIATRESPLPELLSGGGLFIDPRQPSELVAALDSILSSSAVRSEFAAAAIERARALTWRAAAEQLAAVLHSLDLR